MGELCSTSCQETHCWVHGLAEELHLAPSQEASPVPLQSHRNPAVQMAAEPGSGRGTHLSLFNGSESLGSSKGGIRKGASSSDIYNGEMHSWRPDRCCYSGSWDIDLISSEQ